VLSRIRQVLAEGAARVRSEWARSDPQHDEGSHRLESDENKRRGLGLENTTRLDMCEEER
jgi:hypothetical protein